MINKCLKPIIENDGIKVLKVITLCLTAYLLFLLMQSTYYMVQWDFPIHIGEDTENTAAVSFWQGKSPYYEDYPYNFTSYGPLYYLFSSLFLSSDSFLEAAFVQRAINVICTLLTMVVFVLFSRKKLSSSFVESVSLASVLGFMLAFFSNELGSKPGAFAYLFAFLAVIIPSWCNFSKRSFVISISCCSIAFLSKQYFLIFPMVILCYHLLFFGVKRSFFLALLFVLQTYGLLLLLELIYPNITNGFSIGSFSQAVFNDLRAVAMLKRIIFLIWPILIFIVACSMAVIINKRYIKDIICISCLLLKEYYLLFVSCLLFLFYCRFIGHSGNNNIYAPHTFIGFTFLAFLQYISSNRNAFVKCLSLFSLIIVLVLTLRAPDFGVRTQFLLDHTNSWKKWDALIAEHNNMLAQTSFAQLLNKHGKNIYNMFQMVYARPSDSFFYTDELTQKQADLIKEQKQALHSAQYDLLILHYDKPGEYRIWWNSGYNLTIPITEKYLSSRGYVKVDSGKAFTSIHTINIDVFKRAADIKSADK